MKLVLVTRLTMKECQQLFADPRTFRNKRLRGDTLSGGALDRVNPLEFRMKWRWGPLHPFLFVATLTHDGGMTRFEGRLTPHPLFDAMSFLPVGFPELFILTPLIGLAWLLAFVLHCCMPPLVTWFLAVAIILAGIASTIIGGRRLYRRAQEDVLRFLHDAAHASPRRN